MPTWEVLITFFGVALLLGLSPGPDNLFVLVQSAQRFERYTLPGIQRASSDLGLASRQMGHTMANIDANPQSLIYGNGTVRPGPGEPGFAPPAPATP